MFLFLLRLEVCNNFFLIFFVSNLKKPPRLHKQDRNINIIKTIALNRRLNSH